MTQSMRFPSFLLCLLFVQAAVEAQSPVDPDINKKIRQEETDHSQIMHTMHFLTDVYGPRLTGSMAPDLPVLYGERPALASITIPVEAVKRRGERSARAAELQ